MLHLNGTYLSHVYLKADRASAVVSTGLTLYHPLSAGGQKKRWSGPYPAQRDPRPHTGCWWRLLLRNNVYPDSQWGFRTRCIYPGPRGLLNNPPRGKNRAAKRRDARRVSGERRKPLVASATFFPVEGVKSITRPIKY